jgi:hypothetical protein
MIKAEGFGRATACVADAAVVKKRYDAEHTVTPLADAASSYFGKNGGGPRVRLRKRHRKKARSMVRN